MKDGQSTNMCVERGTEHIVGSLESRYFVGTPESYRAVTSLRAAPRFHASLKRQSLATHQCLMPRAAHHLSDVNCHNSSIRMATVHTPTDGTCAAMLELSAPLVPSWNNPSVSPCVLYAELRSLRLE